MKYPSIPAGDGAMRDAATDMIRRYCGWHVAPEIEETMRLDGHGSPVVKLPTLALAEVLAVKVAGRTIDPADVHYSTAGLLRLPVTVPDQFGALEVTVRHGFESASEVAALVETIKERAESTPAGAPERKQVGDVSVYYGAASERGAQLFASERAILDLYRLEGAP